MSSRDLFELEPGDTGESLLKACKPECSPHLYQFCSPACEARYEANKVNDRGAHSDRDGSEEPPPVEAEKVNGRGAQWLPEGSDPVWGDVRHHRERIDQLNSWVRYWSARARTAERKVRQLQGLEP